MNAFRQEVTRGDRCPADEVEGIFLDHMRQIEIEARRLAVMDGDDPDRLVANTLDEEPEDGFAPCGRPAHFLWREKLHRVMG